MALENIKKIMDDKDIPAHISVDVTTADAYQDNKQAEAAVANTQKELDKAAELIITDSPEAPKVKAKNIYTDVKHTLSEGIEDFDIKSSRTNDDEDRYVEFDMFDFIYSLFASQTDALIRPLKAFSNYKKKDGISAFMYQGSDDYIDDTGEKGVQGISQISTDTDGNVILYQDSASDFDSVIQLCDEYGFEYEGPTAKKAPWVRWNFSFKIIVPTYADGYPMEVEDYFAQKDIPIEDVMPQEFIRGRARDYKKLDDEVAVDTIYRKYVKKAGNSNDPLEGFVKEMFKELDANGAKYNKKELKDRFMDEFNDDFGDED